MALEDGQDKMPVVVTPLNLLGKQNVRVLEEGGLMNVRRHPLRFGVYCMNDWWPASSH